MIFIKCRGRVTDNSEGSLSTTAGLMGLDVDELRRALTARVMQATKGGYKVQGGHAGHQGGLQGTEGVMQAIKNLVSQERLGFYISAISE